MDKSPSRRSLDFTLNVLTVFGWWAPDCCRGNWKIHLYKVYQGVTTGFFYLLYTVTEIINIAVVWGDIEKMVEASFLLLTHIAQFSKMVIMFWWSSRIKRLIDTFEDPLFNQKMPEHNDIIKKYVFIVKRDNRGFLAMAAATIVLWTIFPILEASKGWELPLKAWYPFETKDSPIFQVIYTYQITATFIEAYTNICTDTLAAGVMVLTSLQLEVLHYNLVNIGRSQPSGKTNMCESLVHCIRHHQMIIDFVAEQNELFSYVFLSQFFVAVIVICITAFQLTLVPVSIEFVSMILYLACMLTEVLLYCYHGNEIMIRSTDLTEALAQCDWLGQDRDFTKMVLIMMERTKRPLKVTGGKFFTLSLTTFVTIVRSSYSYYAVLKQMHAE